MKKKIMAGLIVATLCVGMFPTMAFAAWQDNNPLIAHCLGEYNGKIETNSKEAFISSWESGMRVFEVDLVYTSDGTLVARHDFTAEGSYYRLEQEANGALEMNSQTYANSKIVFEQTPLTWVDLVGLLQTYNDVYLVTDTKSTDQATVQKQFKDMVQVAENMGATDVLKRVIPQVYHTDMLTWVKEVYPFTDWIYTLYQEGETSTQAIADFCKTNGVSTVTVEKDKVTKELMDTLHASGVKVYAHTVNRYLQMSELLKLGVDGVYTDRIKPYELSWVGLKNTRSLGAVTKNIGGVDTTFTSLDIMGTQYVPLRQLAKLGKDFSADYDMTAKTLSLSTGKVFDGIGNELLLDGSKRLVTKKADFKLFIDEKQADVSVYFVDGEVYVPLDAMSTVLGFV